MILIRKFLSFHWPLFVLMVVMVTAGTYFIESAVFGNEELAHISGRQWTWFFIGLPLFFIVSLVDYNWLIRMGIPIYVGSLFVLICVLIFGVEINDSKSWINLGGLRVQPAELCKLAFICGMAALLLLLSKEIKKIWPLFLLVTVTFIPMALILGQPDLGSAAVFGPITFFMMFVAGVRKRYLAIPVIAGIAGLIFSYVYIYKMDKDLPGLKHYQCDRIRVLFNADVDPQNAGWAVNQCLIAVGSGGLKGQGYKQGDQNLGGFLPRNTSHNDYIFPVIAEEFGFVGGSLLIVGQALILWGILSITNRSKDLSGALLATGVTAMLFTHFFINIGMTIQLAPVTGIPLPFISYGGTFLVACMVGLGIVQSVWIHRKDYQQERMFRS